MKKLVGLSLDVAAVADSHNGRAFEQLLILLRRSIDEARATEGRAPAPSAALRRALALLWAAHDEIEALAAPGRPTDRA